jgi:hypothetical protein
MIDDDGRHACPKIGCDKRLFMPTLACSQHWYAIPEELRRRINRTWRNGSMAEYLAAREEAVAILNA